MSVSEWGWAWATVEAMAGRVGEVVAGEVADRKAAGRPLSAADELVFARKVIDSELAAHRTGSYGTGEPLSPPAEKALGEAVFHHIFELGRIQLLIDDPENVNIHISGGDRVWLERRDGSVIPGPPVAESDDELMDRVAAYARRVGLSERAWDTANATLDLRLPDGSRLHALRSVARRPVVTIRRHDWTINRLHHLLERLMIDRAIFEFLVAMVLARFNVIVSGGTGAGKTTLLRCLLNEVPPLEYLITVEDNLELGLDRFPDLHPRIDALEARPPNIEGEGAITQAQLVREGLRMNPSRVIVGETRGDETLPMLLAMSQGNDGSACSVHSSSSREVFDRIQMYLAACPERLAPEAANLYIKNAVDVVVHVAKLCVNGQQVRRVTSIVEVTGAEGLQVISNEVWGPGPGGWAIPTGVPFRGPTLARLEEHGFDPAWMDKPDGWWDQ